MFAFVRMRRLARLARSRDVAGLRAAVHDKNESVRRLAVSLLVDVGDVRAVDGLLDALQRRELAHIAVEGLVRIGEPALRPLVRYVGNTNSEVAAAALSALRLAGDSGCKVLVETLTDKDGLSVTCAIAAVVSFGVVQAVPSLERLLSHDNPYVRVKALGALGELGGAPQITALVTAYCSAEEDVRAAARDGLQKLALRLSQPQRQFVTAVISLRDRNAKIRTSGAQELGDLRDGRAAMALLDAASVERQDEAVSAAAKGALIRLGPSAVPTLILALDQPSFRNMAACCLARIGDANQKHALLTALRAGVHWPSMAKDLVAVFPDAAERQNATQAILAHAAAEHPEQIGPDGEMYAHRHWPRVRAALILSQLAGGQALDTLLDWLLNDPYGDVQVAAAAALGVLADARAIAGLISVLDRPARIDGDIAEEAARSLARIGGDVAVEAVAAYRQRRNQSGP